MTFRIFKRPRPGPLGAPCDSPSELQAVISGVAVLDDDASSAAWLDGRARLRRIVAEAVVLQDTAVELLADIRRRAPLGELARRGGPLARRFFELRRQLPGAVDAEMARQCETASVVLDHHGTVITFALELLAADWRSDAIVDQLERLDGLGAPAERLDALYAELAR
ncbi:MAG: hypothetical protein QOJ21_1832 [Solirubrobacteraceae bacterium]|jgi:hypothetical protein|nr:hypothetical protein [Solirubrobacteraceae bacterium]